jgi:hypothetical protein
MERVKLNQLMSWTKQNLKFPYQDITQVEYSDLQFHFCFSVPNQETQDSYYPEGVVIPIKHRVSIDIMLVEKDSDNNFTLPAKEVVRLMYVGIGQFAAHEFAECFKWNGQRPYNPHDGNQERNKILFKAIEEVSRVKPGSMFDGTFIFFDFKVVIPNTTVKFDEPVEPEKPLTPLEKKRKEKEAFRDHYAKFSKNNDWNAKQKKSA